MFRNVCNLFDNFLVGPKHKLVYRRHWVHAHLSFNSNIVNVGKFLEISYDPGEKTMHTINMLSWCPWGKDDWRRLISYPDRFGAVLPDPFEHAQSEAVAFGVMGGKVWQGSEA